MFHGRLSPATVFVAKGNNYKITDCYRCYPHRFQYEETDVYDLGLTALQMMLRRTSKFSPMVVDPSSCLAASSFISDVSLSGVYSKQLIQLISKMLHSDPSFRPSLSKISSIIKERTKKPTTEQPMN